MASVVTSHSSPGSSTHIQQPQVMTSQNSHSAHILSLATLSRNASVISTSSSSSSSSLVPTPPVRPRPLRTFSNHSNATQRARSPHSPTSPRGSRIPVAYLSRYDRDSPDYDSRPGSAAGALSPSSRATTPVAPGSRTPNNARSRSNTAPRRGVTTDDFEFGDILGSGSYSSVISATHRASSNAYAIKVVDKLHLQKENKIRYAFVEKSALSKLSHPGVIRMHWAFHDETSVYFVLDLAPNGELLNKIRKLGSLSLECAKYYAAQLVDTLDYIHRHSILHRDVKPENILLDSQMRIKLTDFGSAKILESKDGESPAVPDGPSGGKSSFVGSAVYVSPELLVNNVTGAW
ncbi:pkb-activating kinase-like protein [Tulasnella sp. 419]|nr:pkb-activating kinase-like protein [Tulasnella sp. 419]